MTGPDEQRAPGAPDTGGSTASAFVVYTVARLGIFLALWALAVFVGFDVFLAAVVAAAISLPVSWYLLATQRARLTGRLLASRESRRVIDPDRQD